MNGRSPCYNCLHVNGSKNEEPCDNCKRPLKFNEKQMSEPYCVPALDYSEPLAIDERALRRQFIFMSQ